MGLDSRLALCADPGQILQRACVVSLVFCGPRRDIKSNNILLTKEGVAKVADVGLASMIDCFSSTGTVYGSFTYAGASSALRSDRKAN